jgi:hypothetical protein
MFKPLTIALGKHKDADVPTARATGPGQRDGPDRPGLPVHPGGAVNDERRCERSESEIRSELGQSVFAVEHRQRPQLE